MNKIKKWGLFKLASVQKMVDKIKKWGLFKLASVSWVLFVMFIAVIIAIGQTQCIDDPSNVNTLKCLEPSWIFFNNIDLRGLGFFVAGIGIAPLGLWLAGSRTATLIKQSKNDHLRRIGEDFSRSVELLGHKEIAVRQGAIYALSSLAKENKDMYDVAIRIIASYIRKTEKKNDEDLSDNKEEFNDIDIEAALSIIKNRKKGIDNWEDWEHIPRGKREYVFDMSSSKLYYGGLSNTRLAKVNLSQLYAKGFLFESTDFSSANMVAAKFENCDFTKAIFKKAELNEAKFLKDEDGDCKFKDTDFTDADLKDTDFLGADLSGAINLTQEQIDVAKGNENTKLPEGINLPEDWAT